MTVNNIITASKNDLFMQLSPTQSMFVHSNADVVILHGPMGEGKTHAGAAALIRHAQRCGRDIRAAIIRDTHQNIKTSTVISLKEILGDWVSFHDDNKIMRIKCTPKVECSLFGIDDPASLSKLQGPEYACIWLEEPAPIIERANAGLSRDTYQLCVARAARQTGTEMRVQITQNPADEDHWTESLANEPSVIAKDPDTGVEIIKEVYRIAYGDNKFLNEKARAANIAAFKDDAGKYARYVEGKAAPVSQGVAVTAGYNKAIHYSDTELPVLKNAIGVRFYDAWHHPVCIIGQMVIPAQLWIHEALTMPGSGMRELIENSVIPTLAGPKCKDKIQTWRDIGDPSMYQPDQSTVTRNTAKVVEDLLKTRFEAGPTRWHHRIDPTRTALSQMAPDGSGPKIKLSSTAYNLHRALNGGWHFKKDNNGRTIGPIPVKDSYADLGDAFSYGVSMIFPYVRPKSEQNKTRRRDPRAIANSYATSRTSGQKPKILNSEVRA